MRNVAVFTGTRAEYGLLYWLMKEIQASKSLHLQLIVGGMHLSSEFGETWRQIELDGFQIDAKIEMLLSSNTPVGVAKSIGLGTIGCADVLERLRPDLLIVLGDRFETLAVSQTAMVFQIPVAHIHGGEVTEGAYDDTVRHSITKMAHLHFAAAESYSKRIIQLGEQPESVFNVGAVGLDHLKRTKLLNIKELAAQLNFELNAPYFVVTYHPVTQGKEDPVDTVRSMLAAIDEFQDHKFILTYPNADNGGRAIIPIIEEFASSRPGRALALPSMGSLRYLSAVKGAAAIIGNSSSGLIEAPAFGIPTVNIGLRQLGRLAADSVLHCQTDYDAIHSAINVAISVDFVNASKKVTSLYGQGDAASTIVRILESHSFSSTKHFYDL